MIGIHNVIWSSNKSLRCCKLSLLILHRMWILNVGLLPSHAFFRRIFHYLPNLGSLRISSQIEEPGICNFRSFGVHGSGFRRLQLDLSDGSHVRLCFWDSSGEWRERFGARATQYPYMSLSLPWFSWNSNGYSKWAVFKTCVGWWLWWIILYFPIGDYNSPTEESL